MKSCRIFFNDLLPIPLVPKIFEFLFGIIYDGYGGECGIDGKDDRFEAHIQLQIVSLLNDMITDNAAGGSATVVEGGSWRVTRFKG